MNKQQNLIERLQALGMNYAANQFQIQIRWLSPPPPTSILDAFTWAETPESYDFWSYVASKLGEKLTTGSSYYPL